MPTPPKRVVSLGTTDVPERDGRFCCCAIQANGAIEYGIKTAGDFPPGEVLEQAPDRAWRATGESVDLEKFLTPLKSALARWEVRPAPILLQGGRQVFRYQAGGILGGLVRWYPNEADAPRSPACARSDVEALLGARGELAHVTAVVELGIQLSFEEDGEGRYYAYRGRAGGHFRCKFNGRGSPPRVLGPGSMLAIFLSDHSQNPDRTVIPDGAVTPADFRKERYWYLKIGSVLVARRGEPLAAVPQGVIERLILQAIRGKLRLSIDYDSVELQDTITVVVRPECILTVAKHPTLTAPALRAVDESKAVRRYSFSRILRMDLVEQPEAPPA